MDKLRPGVTPSPTEDMGKSEFNKKKMVHYIQNCAFLYGSQMISVGRLNSSMPSHARTVTTLILPRKEITC